MFKVAQTLKQWFIKNSENVQSCLHENPRMIFKKQTTGLEKPFNTSTEIIKGSTADFRYRLYILIQDKITLKILNNHFHCPQIKSGSLKWCFGCLKSFSLFWWGIQQFRDHTQRQRAVASPLQRIEASVCVCVCGLCKLLDPGRPVVFQSFYITLLTFRNSCANQYIQ